MADNFAQTVKQQADIVKIIGEYVKLRKTGAKNYGGLCPFHKEKTPSFSVNVSGFYHCFGCKESGDVFSFVQKLENVNFPEAVRIVATKMGIPLPKREFNSPEEAREAGLRKQLYDMHEAATRWFEQHLQSPEAARAREYLSGRGVSPETIQTFRIGYAPDDFNALRDALKPHFNEDAMRASGLFSSKEQGEDGRPVGNLYSRFRKRITFPIANEQGRVIAFTARALDSDEKSGPKYMNSPETPLYSKGNVLFNLDKAKSAMREQDYALLVEGQMDCISVYMAGIHPVIATSGTAFTEAQARLLGRFTKRIVLNFDPDTAGANAAEKSLALLTEEGFEIKVITLDDGMDPDRFVRERGIHAYAAELRAAKPFGDYLIERARKLYPQQTPEAKVRAVNFLLPHIRRMPSAIHRDVFVNDAAQKLGIDGSLMKQEVRKAAASRVESIRRPMRSELTDIERTLLTALVRPAGESARDTASVEVSMHPEWVEGLTAGPVLEKLSMMEPEGNPLEAASDAHERDMIARVLADDTGVEGDTLLMKVHGALHTLKKRWIERRRRELRVMIAEAEQKNDREALEQALAEDLQLARVLRSL